MVDAGLVALASINLGGSCHCEWASARVPSFRRRARLPTCPPRSRRLRAAPRSPRRRPHSAPRSAACTAPTRTTRHARCRARPLPPGAFVGRARSHRHTATAAHAAAAAAAAAGQVSGGARALGNVSGRYRFLFVFLWSCGVAVCVWCDLAQIERKHSGEFRASPRRNPANQCGNRAGQRRKPAGQHGNSADQRGNSAGQCGNSAGQRGSSAGQRGNSAESARC